MPQDHDPKHVKPTGVMQARLAQIDRLEPTMEKLSDAELQRKTLELKDRLRSKRAWQLLDRSRPMHTHTLAEAVEQHRAGRDFWATLNAFLDEFYAADDERQSMIEQEPALIGDPAFGRLYRCRRRASGTALGARSHTTLDSGKGAIS